MSVVFRIVLSLVVFIATGMRFENTAPQYHWTQLTRNAAFPAGYNFPVFVAKGKMWAFHPEGTWSSMDGATWTKSDLPSIKGDAYQCNYVFFEDAVYGLGNNTGNYLDITFNSMVRTTSDFISWKTVAQTTNLPNRIFGGVIVFKGKIWMVGGYDGKNYHNDVWNSSDGVVWSQALDHAPWSERTISTICVFKDKLWIIGGGLIDGEGGDTMTHHEVWSTTNGIEWQLVSEDFPGTSSGTPIVFDERLWLVGANRNAYFGRASLVTADGIHWSEETAPWSARGGIATWIFNDNLYITGGKFSEQLGGETKFRSYNDVWVMSKSEK